ncbi:hypothetical protein HPB47_009938, partial [Ixodes persulcatus]
MAAHDLLSLNRRVARKASSEQHDSCLLAGVDVLTRTVNRDVTRGSRDSFVKAVDFFKENDQRLLQADKEGGFGAMTAGTFSEKARLVVEKNFKAVKPSALRVKSRAVQAQTGPLPSTTSPAGVTTATADVSVLREEFHREIGRLSAQIAALTTTATRLHWSMYFISSSRSTCDKGTVPFCVQTVRPCVKSGDVPLHPPVAFRVGWVGSTLGLAFDLDLDLLGLATRRGVLLRDLDRPFDPDLERDVSSGGNSELRRAELSALVVSGGA